MEAFKKGTVGPHSSLILHLCQLMLYGRSYSKLLAFEAARIFHRLGCDVRVYDPDGLPVKDGLQHDHPKVVELRDLSRWSDGHFWVSPEQHGNLVRWVDCIPCQCSDGFRRIDASVGRCLQEPNRLDTSQYRLRAPYAGQDPRNRHGVRRLTVL